jgi:hypothetical protein
MAMIQPNTNGKELQAYRRLRKQQQWIKQQSDSATASEREAFQKQLNLTLIHIAMIQSKQKDKIE